MKTNQPNQINYKAQYALMTATATVMPYMPRTIKHMFVAFTTPRMVQAEQNAHVMHVDRFDLIVDWGCLVQRTAVAR